jgi:uncharacterized protein (DUF427 family)
MAQSKNSDAMRGGGESHRESVWDYPRPPRLEPSDRRIRVVAAGVAIADTRRALRILETSHPPTYYLPPNDVRVDLLRPSERSSFCEFKGCALYYDLLIDDELIENCAWTYPEPMPRYAALVDHLAFFAGLVDECWVDDERARPQPGGFYGGWITSDLDGPFKGDPGTSGW